MRKVILLGTLHAGLTPTSELKAELERIRPDQLLVEITDEDLKSGQLGKYSPEMVAAYKWAKQNRIPVAGFDAKINVFRPGITGQDNVRVIELQKQQIGNLTWKDLNQPENYDLLRIPEYGDLVDPDKERERWQAMAENIEKSMVDEGTILVLTGCGNLGFFKKELNV